PPSRCAKSRADATSPHPFPTPAQSPVGLGSIDRVSLVERVPGTAPAWDITLPAPSAHLPGITMVGFDGGAGQAIDLQIVPYPAVTITVDVDRHHHLFVLDEITGRRTQGSVAAGLGPSAVRCGGSSVASLKIRLSPLVAYAVFGES